MPKEADLKIVAFKKTFFQFELECDKTPANYSMGTYSTHAQEFF